MSCCLTYSYAEPACLDFNIQQGGYWRFTVTLYEDLAQTTPFDLTGYTGTLRFVSTANHATVVMTATVTIAAPTTGVILCELAAATTAPIPTTPTLLHDLFLAHASDPSFYVLRGSTTIIEGYSA